MSKSDKINVNSAENRGGIEITRWEQDDTWRKTATMGLTPGGKLFIEKKQKKVKMKRMRELLQELQEKLACYKLPTTTSYQEEHEAIRFDGKIAELEDIIETVKSYIKGGDS